MRVERLRKFEAEADPLAPEVRRHARAIGAAVIYALLLVVALAIGVKQAHGQEAPAQGTQREGR